MRGAVQHPLHYGREGQNDTALIIPNVVGFIEA